MGLLENCPQSDPVGLPYVNLASSFCGVKMGEMGRWGDGEMGRWGDGEMGL
ncbi:MAG: hypothetical protein SW833_01260 [Cyanobacteriota bacterium]|nr:hypothetical protein [Cyanobacteriota bacterium]